MSLGKEYVYQWIGGVKFFIIDAFQMLGLMTPGTGTASKVVLINLSYYVCIVDKESILERLGKSCG